MLRPFLYKQHKIQRFQSFVNHVFLEIICRAPKLKSRYPTFPFGLVAPKYNPILEEVNQEYIKDPLCTIYEVARDLPPESIKTLRRAVVLNNRIEELCKGEAEPVLYSDLEKIDNPEKTLTTHIKILCKHLYNEVMDRAPFTHTYGKLNAYYKFIMGRTDVCKCCGLTPVLNAYNAPRDAFDHYLPRDKYPFVAVNFRNLVPACYHCNSSYKHTQDTLHYNPQRAGQPRRERRTKAFYPFRKDPPDIRISLSLSPGCLVKKIKLRDFTLQIESPTHPDEVKNWQRLYGIEERYKGYYCSESLSNFYEEQYLAQMIHGKSAAEYIQDLQKK
ncbi:MAG: hypothetical protein LUF85_10110 [Bacteroides sp.]|nr:hypothetical protein [Bacteroides sp.]